MSPLEHALGRLVDEDEEHGCGDLPEEDCAAVPVNAARQVTAQTLQKVGDLLVDARTVLSWLIPVLGAPTGLVGLLVPIREAGSLLPQAALVPVVRRLPVRKWIWVTGGLAQAAAVGAMALITATLRGTVAGLGILVALAVFAVARSLSSIASKDVLGRTIPKGLRGRVNGWATIGGGAAAITVGLAMRLLGTASTPPAVFAWLLLAAAGAWLVAVVIYARVGEHAGEHDPRTRVGAGAAALGLLRHDAAFRRFVLVRTLLLVSALSPPFVVALATTRTAGTGLRGLGPFVLSSGIASLLGGQLWGTMADRSSRRTMTVACATGSGVLLVLLALLRIDEVARIEWLYPATYLLLALAHTGARIGRKTYVVDLAEGNRRTDYVAASNTAMGVLLLVTGGLSAAAASVDVEAALLLLALLGLAGVAVSRTLPEVTAPGS